MGAACRAEAGVWCGLYFRCAVGNAYLCLLPRTPGLSGHSAPLFKTGLERNEFLHLDHTDVVDN